MTGDSNDVIRTYLLRDVVDSTAAAVFAANPGKWDTDADVPIYLYTSLCTLWTGSSGDVVAYNKALSPGSGESKNKAENCIWIDPFICDQSEATDATPWVSDIEGGENALIYIGFSYKKASTNAAFDKDRTLNAELRVRELLDQNLRSKNTLQAGGRALQDLPIPSGYSINKSYGLFRLSWKGYTSNPGAIEIVSEYHASYVREFAKVVIP